MQNFSTSNSDRSGGKAAQTSTKAQPAHVDVNRLYQAFSSFAGRVAATDDPKEHQKAAAQLQRELRGVRG